MIKTARQVIPHQEAFEEPVKPDAAFLDKRRVELVDTKLCYLEVERLLWDGWDDRGRVLVA